MQLKSDEANGCDGHRFCRICHSAAGEDEVRDDDATEYDEDIFATESDEAAVGWQLINLCNCSGSVAYTHARCLNRWLHCSQTKSCELCGAAYPLAARADKTGPRLTCLLLPLYLSYLFRYRRIELISDASYTMLLFSPSAAFLALNLQMASFKEFKTCLQTDYDVMAAMICGILLLLLTMATWLVTVFATQRESFRHWCNRRFMGVWIIDPKQVSQFQ